MKKLALLAASATLCLGAWGCSHTPDSEARSHTPSYQRPMERQHAPTEQPLNEKERAQRDRQGAPTVYDGEATGGAGATVTTPDGQTWTPESQPGNTASQPPSPDNSGK